MTCPRAWWVPSSSGNSTSRSRGDSITRPLRRVIRSGVILAPSVPGEAGLREPVWVLVIDAANVIGSRPTGWWRDRPGAARVFTARVRASVTAGRLESPVTIVLEGQARAGAAEAEEAGVAVVHAPAGGDDTIAAVAEANRGVVVVTADRELAARVRAATAEVVGPGWLLDRLRTG